MSKPALTPQENNFQAIISHAKEYGFVLLGIIGGTA